jgi:lipopolysaccharide/colanic/teichoic acid biosynthesis glycosyltransferase
MTAPKQRAAEKRMSAHTQNLVLIAVLVALDALMILTGWWLAYEWRMVSDFLPAIQSERFQMYREVVLMALPLWIAIFAFCRLYDREELLGGPQEYGNVVKGCLIGFAALIGVSMFIKTPDLARGWLIAGLALTTILVGAMRFAVRRVFYSLRGRGWFVQRALIVGTNDDARAIARQLSPYQHTGVQVVGFVDDYLPVDTPIVGNMRVVAATRNLDTVSAEQRVDQVILVSGAMTWESFDQLLRGITLSREGTYAIKLSPGLYETLTTGVRVSYKNRVPLLEIERAPITGIDALLKGALDYTVGLLALLLSLPLMALIAAVLVVLGRRPVIEAHQVLGKNGVIFRTYLFSSMIPAPEAREWQRGRSLGRFLFETGLNKLPQLWNILRGNMSLVGPRPVNPNNAAEYETWLPNLLSLKPGMTGARASSAENSITLEQEMRLELYYARNYSIWLDLQILFQTLVRVLHRERVLRKLDAENSAVRAQWRPASPLPTERS